MREGKFGIGWYVDSLFENCSDSADHGVTQIGVSTINQLFFFCLLLLNSPGLSIDLPNGGVVAGEISVIGEIDEFTFTADAGDTVFIEEAELVSVFVGISSGQFELPSIVSDFF